ncbi:MAG: hypothetical protein LBF89_02850 [Bacteroidales bacterium]|jgi:hypothetical protein|nr:hypothetical protein [Bacteroidales bacterium]
MTLSSVFGFRSPERIFRKMGYFGDQRGILRRYRREQSGWDIHLQNTQSFAIRSAQDKDRRSAIVLGSGWLLDVPLKELSAMFGKVTLADIRHPAQVRRRAEQLCNVTPEICDISGFARSVYHYAQQYRRSRKRPPLDSIAPDRLPELSDYGFVFSCNILSQLSSLLEEYLLQYFEIQDEELMAFRRKVQQLHIAGLPKGRSCLVTDFEENTFRPTGEDPQKNILIDHPVIQNPHAQRWVWHFDTRMTYSPGRITSMEVLAVQL